MNSVKSLTAAALAAITLAACGQPSSDGAAAPEPEASESPVALELAGGNPAAEAAAKTITADYMREIIKEISDDRYEGRGPGSAGDKMARDYIVERMKEAGLEPGAADGSWEQTFDLLGINASQPPEWSFSGHGEELVLKQWERLYRR